MNIAHVAKSLIVDKDGAVLVLRRSDTHPTRALKPDLPGGLVDDGEDFGQALIREIFEETGITVDFASLSSVYAGTDVHG